jgi:molybdate transport system ATP-binding protein
MSLSVSLQHRLGDFALDASFESAGRLIALFGPSGCGKSTLVNGIAGLLRPGQGKISLDGQVIADTVAGVWPPAHRRRMGYVFQDARLFPHLTVAQNLAYGQWFTPAQERYAEPDNIIALLGLSTLLGRRPQQLSGGEKQRVAIGRALLQSPRLLLMDEPLASLDEARKHEVLPYIERLRDEVKIPIIYVSHAPAEVARLATDIVLMAQGRVIRFGPAAELLPALGEAGAEFSREAGSAIAAEVVGFDRATGLTTLASDAGTLRVSGDVAAAGAKLRVFIRASDVMIATEKPKGLSALNIIKSVVKDVTAVEGFASVVTLVCGCTEISARVTQHSARHLALAPGLSVYAVVKAVSIRDPGGAAAQPG